MSANPTYPRVQFTDQSFINPLEAPMFCMLLRKYCESGTIEAVRQVGNERIIHMDVRQRDDLVTSPSRRLLSKLWAPYSNIILLDATSQTIHDGIHHVTPAISSFRVVMPGALYSLLQSSIKPIR